ncbi:hypothetical protein [Paenibacillus tyrfis]|uniref:hypothetical protein n=1 Tax=Paenibacillus tyrfis TaxID=1501230 RepID=UPI00126A477B|nr:hypothetical protein [Paenibacillus tyrfis]
MTDINGCRFIPLPLALVSSTEHYTEKSAKGKLAERRTDAANESQGVEGMMHFDTGRFGLQQNRMERACPGKHENYFSACSPMVQWKKAMERSAEKLIDETAETAKTGLNEGGFCHAVKKTRAGRPFGHSGEDR